MTLTTISPSSNALTYQPNKLTGNTSVVYSSDNPLDANQTSISLSSEIAASNAGALTRTVLQTIQNLGIDTTELSTDKTVAVQNFVQSLYRALNSEGNPIENNGIIDASPAGYTDVMTPHSDSPDSVDLNDVRMNSDIGTSVTILNAVTDDTMLITGGANFKYSIDLSQANLGDYQSAVIADVIKALEMLGQYINSDIVFNIRLIGQTMDRSILAQADATMIEAKTSTQKSIDTSFISDSIYKSELNPHHPDTNLIINLSRLEDMSFNGVPAADKFDFVSIITHELLHGLAFTGTLGNTNTTLKTKYDQLVTKINDIPYFVGANAIEANGGEPVLLAPENRGPGSAFYHVAQSEDLMSDAINKGQIKPISALDIAILKDLSMPINNSNPLTKLQNIYGDSGSGIQKILDTVQRVDDLNTKFQDLMVAFGAVPELNLNLQSFLTQLASNARDTPPIGSLISLTA
jgi:citrate lyase gamma subunit